MCPHSQPDAPVIRAKYCFKLSPAAFAPANDSPEASPTNILPIVQLCSGNDAPRRATSHAGGLWGTVRGMDTECCCREPQGLAHVARWRAVCPVWVRTSVYLAVTQFGLPAHAENGASLFRATVQPVLSEACFKCHGPDEKQRKAGLRLDLPEGALQVRADGKVAVKPGDRSESEMWKRISAEDPEERMPPPDTGKTLTGEQIDAIGRWIEEGAPYLKHWAFEAPQRIEPPGVTNEAWVRNSMDRFILARLESLDIQPAPEADKSTLLRRVYLDLVGLPPSIDALESFLRDNRPDAYEHVVDGLLASPHFGERWGRHWLDAARYADSNGYSIDGPREIWKYRDWVIDAFNADLPFDRFTIAQLAGDLLPESTTNDIVATGFHRNTMINQEGGIDPEEFRIATVIDRVNTTGTVFLGLTVGCAQCHAHKYDPITQEDYYRLFAFFNSDDEKTLELPTDAQRRKLEEIQARTGALEAELAAYIGQAGEAIAEWEKRLSAETIGTFKEDEQEALRVPAEARTEDHRKLVVELFKRYDVGARERVAAIEAIKKDAPKVPTTMVLAKRAEPRETRLFEQGDFTRPKESVTPGTPAVLHPFNGGENATRLDLALWLVDPANPLMGRVTVNRFWQHLFGRGLVETENDFGLQGARPSHSDLLDWLALEFRESGWSMKSILRVIVTSATYRQSSHVRPDLAERDPDNRLLARQRRLRLDAEIIRDAMLAGSGVLDATIGGPGVFPPIPEGVMSLGQVTRDWNVSEGGNRFRRGMYTYAWRATPYPALTVFDAPDGVTSCTRRNRSNTPLQALTLLNDDAFNEQARWLARRVLREAPHGDAERVRYAYRLCLAREPSAREMGIVLTLLTQQRESFAALPDDGRLILADDRADDISAVEVASWTMVGRALFNLDEFITRE